MTRTREVNAAPRAAAARRPIPPRIGSWQPVSLVARGPLTTVYQARPLGGPQGREAAYALKVLRPDWENDPQALELVRREAMVGTTVAHPHVVSVLQWEVARPPYHLVMPWLEGITLDGQLSLAILPVLPAALWIARQVAQGLEALLDAGWIHADVKPANIMLGADGHTTLLDLGYCREADERGSVADRPVVGTLHYMAPEMLTSALAADSRSDIYSLGVVLYQMLTGRLPYEGRNPAEIAAMQREGVPDRLRCLAPQLPRPVVELVRSMLAKEPLRRPQKPGEVVARLAALEIATIGQR